MGRVDRRICAVILLLIAAAGAPAAGRPAAQPASAASKLTLAQLIGTIRAKARALEGSAGMRLSFQSFTSASRIRTGSASYPDYVLVRAAL